MHNYKNFHMDFFKTISFPIINSKNKNKTIEESPFFFAAITNQIFFTHFNKFQKNQLDSLYVENERKRDGEKDYQNWIKLDNVRKEDAKKLL